MSGSIRNFRLAKISQSVINHPVILKDLPSRLVAIGLIVIFVSVITGLTARLPLQLASWFTFFAVLIMPGYFLAEIIAWRLNLDLIERLALAFPLGLAAIAPAGLVVLSAHLTIRELILGWFATVWVILIVWSVSEQKRLSRDIRRQGSPWSIDEAILLALLLGAFAYSYPVLSMYKIDGDMYTFLAFVREAMSGGPINATEPIFGTEIGPGVRTAFQQFLPLWVLWSHLSHLDPIDLSALGTHSALALWAIFASYMLGKASGDGSRRFGLFTASIQMLVYMAGVFFRHDSASIFFFKFTNADKFTVSVVMLPVVFALAIRFLRKGETKAWQVAALAAFAVSTVHPLIAAMLSLALAAFGGLYLILNLYERESQYRFATLAAVSVLVMIVPLIQLALSRGEERMASTYPSSFEGWPIGKTTIPFLPFVQVQALDVYGPLPDLAMIEGDQANSDASPFLIWRFALNMRRQRIIVFNLNRYIAHPSLLLEPPYLIALLLTPFLFKRLRENPAAQFTLSANLAIAAVLFNPVITPLLGSFVAPWILWRIVWMLPFALTIALVSNRFMSTLARLVAGFPMFADRQNMVQAMAPLAIIVLVGFLLRTNITKNLSQLQNEAAAPRIYPTPERILARLKRETDLIGPVTVAADQELSVVVPAYIANANVIAHRIFNTSEFFPADQQDRALQRLIDQHHLIYSPFLTTESIEVLRRYEIRFIIAPSGSELDLQLRLSPKWFEWLIDDQSYTLFAVREKPAITESIWGNDAIVLRKWEEAQKHYQNALQKDPDNLLAIAGLAEAYRFQGQFDPALDQLKRLISLSPLPILHYRLGQFYTEIGQVEQSIPEFDAAQREEPLVSRFHIGLGNACLRVGNYPCANEQFRAAVTVKEETDEASRLIALAGLWEQRGNADLALALYKEAVSLRPDLRNQLVMAGALQRTGQFDKAEEQLQFLRNRFPLSAVIASRLARLLAEAGKIDQAIELYHRAIWFQDWQVKDSTEIRLSLAQALLGAGRLQDARVEIDKVVQSQPNNAFAYILLGSLYSAENKPQEAIATFKHALELNPKQVAPYVYLSMHYKQQANITENLDLLEDMMQVDQYQQVNPGNAPLILSLGDQLQLHGDTHAAIAAYLVALDLLAPDSLPMRYRQHSIENIRVLAYIRLAKLYEDLGDIHNAMHFYQAAATTIPDESRSKVVLGDALRRRNEAAAAEAIYRQVIQNDPAYVEAYLHLIDLLNARGDIVAADELLQQAVKIFRSRSVKERESESGISASSLSGQEDISAFAMESGEEESAIISVTGGEASSNLMNILIRFLESDQEVTQVELLARLYQETDQLTKAAELYEQKIKSAEAEGSLPLVISRYHQGLGAVYLSQGKLNDAIETYRRAIELNAWMPEALIGLAKVYSERGETRAALEQLKRAVEMAPGSIPTQLALADALNKNGDVDQAFSIYLSLGQSYPGNAQASLALASAWKDRSRPDRAEEIYQQILAINPGTPSLYVGLADLYRAQAYFEEAEALFRQAIQIDGTQSRAILNLGELLALQGRYGEAEVAYEQALRIDPDNWRVYAGLGAVKQALGQTTEALALLNQAAEADPAAHEPLLALAALYREQGQTEQAEEALFQALGRSPGNAVIRSGLADLYRSQVRNEEALSQLRLAVEENPGLMEALVHLADELRRQGQAGEAEQVYQQAEQASQPSPAGYRALANAYQIQGKLEKALGFAEQALTLAPEEAVNWLLKGQLEAGLGNTEAALASLQQATHLAPAQSRILLSLGDSYKARGRWKAAESAYRQAISIAVVDPAGYVHLGELYAARGRHSDALVQYQTALEVAPHSTLALSALGHWFEAAGDWDAAQQAYQKIIELAPAEIDGYLNLGNLFMMRGWPTEAYKQFQEALIKSPAGGAVYIALGDWFKAALDYEAAEREYRKAIKIEPGGVQGYLKLGELFVIQGRYPDALKLFQKALEVSPMSSLAYVGFADWHYQRGDWETAEQLYRKAIEIAPGSLNAYIRLGLAYQAFGRQEDALDIFEAALLAGVSPNASICGPGRLPDQPMRLVGSAIKEMSSFTVEAWQCRWEYRLWSE